MSVESNITVATSKAIPKQSKRKSVEKLTVLPVVKIIP